MYTLEVNYVDLFGQPYYYPPVQQIAKVPKHLTVIIDKTDPSPYILYKPICSSNLHDVLPCPRQPRWPCPPPDLGIARCSLYKQ